MRGAPPPTMTAQLTIGKSIDLRMANLRKALLAPAGGAGTWISVMISPGRRTVLPGNLTSKKFSALILRVFVTMLAFNAMRAGAMSLGWTAMHLLTLPKIE